MSNLYTNPASTADETTQYITAQLRTGASRAAIIDALVTGGWSRSDAESAVESTERLLQRQGGIPAAPIYGGADRVAKAQTSPARAEAVRHIFIGMAWLLGGIILTAVGYAMAEGGGVYIVFTGAMFWGAVEMIRGFIGCMKSD